MNYNDRVRALHILEGSATSEEREQFDRRKKDSPELEKEYTEMHDAWKASEVLQNIPEPDTAQLWAGIEAQLREETHAVRRHMLRPSRRSFFSGWRIALTGSGLVAAALLLFFLTGKNPPVPQSTTLVCNPGQTLSATLADGTEISLQDSSVLTYSTSLQNDAVRIVDLRGEGKFHVTHNDRPFYVITANTRIEVMGTIFHVYARPTVTSLVVEEGLVHFRSLTGDTSIVRVVKPGFRSDCEGNNVPAQPVAQAEPVRQTPMSRILVYQNATLGSIAKELEIVYGVNISIPSQKLGQQLISARFENRKLDEILTVLCSVTDAKCVRRNATSIELSE